MNITELKDKVNLSMTKDEVRAFGDLRLKSTWQATYDSISQPDVVQEETSVELISETESVSVSQDETGSFFGVVGYTVGLLWVTLVYLYRATVSLSSLPYWLMQAALAYYKYYGCSISHWSVTQQHRLALWLSSNILIGRYIKTT